MRFRRQRLKRLLVSFTPNEIQYPERASEFEIQAELYQAIKSAGFDVRGEVRASCMDFGNQHLVRIDLVVFRDCKAVALVECKRDANEMEGLDTGTRQGRRYSRFGLPVIVCGSLEQIPFAVQEVEECLTSLAVLAGKRGF